MADAETPIPEEADSAPELAVDEGPHAYFYEKLTRADQVALADARLLQLEREYAGLALAEAEAGADPHAGGNSDDRSKARETVEARAGAVKAWLRGAAERPAK